MTFSARKVKGQRSENIQQKQITSLTTSDGIYREKKTCMIPLLYKLTYTCTANGHYFGFIECKSAGLVIHIMTNF